MGWRRPRWSCFSSVRRPCCSKAATSPVRRRAPSYFKISCTIFCFSPAGHGVFPATHRQIAGLCCCCPVRQRRPRISWTCLRWPGPAGRPRSCTASSGPGWRRPTPTAPAGAWAPSPLIHCRSDSLPLPALPLLFQCSFADGQHPRHWCVRHPLGPRPNPQRTNLTPK